MTNKFSDEEIVELKKNVSKVINICGSLPDLPSRITVLSNVLCFFIATDCEDRKTMDLVLDKIINTLPNNLEHVLTHAVEQDEADEQ